MATENVLSVDDQVCILSIAQTANCLITGKQVPVGYARHSLCMLCIGLFGFVWEKNQFSS